MELFDLFINKIKTDISKLKDYVSEGKCKDFEDYKRICGEINGLKSAIYSFNDIIKKYIKEEI